MPIKRFLLPFTFLALCLPASAIAAWSLNSGVVGGGNTKTLADSLQIGMETQATTSDPAVDIYFAVSLPNNQLYFFHTNALFASPSLDQNLTPYFANVSPASAARGQILNLPSLQGLPLGAYKFYLLLVTAGADLLDATQWQSPLFAVDLQINPASQATINEQTLAIPPVLTGTMDNAGNKVFSLMLKKGQKEFITGVKTDTFGINTPYLGSTVRVRKGDMVIMKVNNQLGEPTTLHWHGLHVPPDMDGGPHQIIQAGATWEPTFAIKQPASTLWFHPHLMGKTAEHVYRGLAGLMIIDDDAVDALALPKTYGVDDIPLVIQDRTINDDGSMPYANLTQNQIMQGFKGNKILVNGAITPTWHASAQVVRLRILNGSNARVYNLGFSDNRTFYQIGTDGGLLEKPVSLTRVRLSPAERAEILVDLRQDAGKSLGLKSYSSEIAGQIALQTQLKDSMDNSDFKVMQITVDGTANNGLSIPDSLVTITRLQESDAVKTRPFVMNMAGPGVLTINGVMMDMKVINETVKLNTTEIWAIGNTSPMAHPFHVHDIQFLILDRNGVAPPANEMGWKDTVWVLANETVRVIGRFEDYANPTSPFMYHCHILEHEDAGMMGQFVVVE